MGNNESFIDDILSEWNGSAIDFDAYLKKNSDKSLLVDIYPFEITDAEKNWQVEIFYRKFLDKQISSHMYLAHEQRYLQFVKYLWLYNATDVFYDLHFERYFKKGLKKQIFTKKRKQVGEELNIDSWSNLVQLVVLALREAGYVILHCKDQNIVAMIHDFSVLILCKSKNTVIKIKELAKTSGLFTRLYKE